jgi:LDH2 family malate/lactate/ureidoglycolate dehydrogenase
MLHENQNGLEILAAGSIAAAAGTVTCGRGILSAANAGVGIVTVTLPPDGGVDASECMILVNVRNPLAASGMAAIGVTHTSDTVKQFNIWQEQGGGAASAAANINFDFAIIKTRPC